MAATSKVLSNGCTYSTVPESYIRPESQRHKLKDVVSSESIPIIDLASPDKADTIRRIGLACEDYGFFQVINHGISVECTEKMLEVAHQFFNLPVEEKMKFHSNDVTKTTPRVATSFVVDKETIHNWRDYLRIHCYPLEDFIQDWPSNPPSFKEDVGTYCKEVRQLAVRLLGAISESLGLEKDYIDNVLGGPGQHMTVNYYPLCPQPDLTLGLPPHTDPYSITILLQEQVAGLQVLKDGKWIAINPHPGAFVVNIGDMLQALSNGRYKSVWHRAIVNSDTDRITLASFISPAKGAKISPINGSPAVYRDFTYEEYFEKFWTRSLEQTHSLEFFKV